jgi:hypothetical protein
MGCVDLLLVCRVQLSASLRNSLPDWFLWGRYMAWILYYYQVSSRLYINAMRWVIYFVVNGTCRMKLHFAWLYTTLRSQRVQCSREPCRVRLQLIYKAHLVELVGDGLLSLMWAIYNLMVGNILTFKGALTIFIALLVFFVIPGFVSWMTISRLCKFMCCTILMR